MKTKAYAKINLTLDIIGKRSDGYHSLKSIMVPISLFDVVTVEKSDELIFDCDLPVLRENNHCVKAAKLYFESSGIKGGADIKLNKHIPFPAGLGGGSSDAAATLRLLNNIYNHAVSEEDLAYIALGVGSDVPFCLYGKPALCEGRGEILTPLDNIGKFYIVVAIGSDRLPTAQVYDAYDNAGEKPTDFSDKMLAALKNGDKKAFYSSVGNAFEPVAEKLCPNVRKIKSLLLKYGAVSAILSGSGPSVFGIFESEEKAIKAAVSLRGDGFFAVSGETFD